MGNKDFENDDFDFDEDPFADFDEVASSPQTPKSSRPVDDDFDFGSDDLGMGGDDFGDLDAAGDDFDMDEFAAEDERGGTSRRFIFLAVLFVLLIVVGLAGIVYFALQGRGPNEFDMTSTAIAQLNSTQEAFLVQTQTQAAEFVNETATAAAMPTDTPTPSPSPTFTLEPSPTEFVQDFSGLVFIPGAAETLEAVQTSDAAALAFLPTITAQAEAGEIVPLIELPDGSGDVAPVVTLAGSDPSVPPVVVIPANPEVVTQLVPPATAQRSSERLELILTQDAAAFVIVPTVTAQAAEGELVPLVEVPGGSGEAAPAVTVPGVEQPVVLVTAAPEEVEQLAPVATAYAVARDAVVVIPEVTLPGGTEIAIAGTATALGGIQLGPALTQTSIALTEGVPTATATQAGLTANDVLLTATSLAQTLSPITVTPGGVEPTATRISVFPTQMPGELPDTGLFDDINSVGGLGSMMLVAIGLVGVIIVSRRMRR
ncbi:MAG TPA: hypothetical protein PKX07_05990 [Aggregatilineales bacterium]|jgi:hypothetical protein|nr:hypothetical protein [Aggregatilineales bacterium]